RSSFVSKPSLGIVESSAFHVRPVLDFLERYISKQLQESHHIGIRDVPPKLPVFELWKQIAVEPDSTSCAFAHLLPIASRDEWRGQAKDTRFPHLPDELHAVDDIAPLIGTAEL